MKTGKLTNEQLTSLVLSRLPALSKNTLVGAGIGADCAWMKAGDNLVVTSSDPITAGGKNSGTLAVHVSCNDIAACGIKPTGILIVIIVPPEATEKDVSDIVDQASETASSLGVDIVGGHTEVSDAVNKFVVISTAFGIVDKSYPVPRGKALPGDVLIQTKTSCLEGSYIAAHEHYERLLGEMDEKLVNEARKYSDYISVVKEGSLCGQIKDKNGATNENGMYLSAVNLMHDITEGGVYGAAYEMAHFSGLGVTLNQKDIPLTKASSEICRVMNLDPYRLISSGSLLIATGEGEKVLEVLHENGVEASIIGKFTEVSEGFNVFDMDGNKLVLDPPAPDEMYKM